MLISNLRSKYYSFNYPLLMMLAGNDYIVDNRVSYKIFSKIGTPQKQLITFPGAFHELQKEPVAKD